MTDDTHTYEAGGLPVALTLPAGEHPDSDWVYINGDAFEMLWNIDEAWPPAWCV